MWRRAALFTPRLRVKGTSFDRFRTNTQDFRRLFIILGMTGGRMFLLTAAETCAGCVLARVPLQVHCAARSRRRSAAGTHTRASGRRRAARRRGGPGEMERRTAERRRRRRRRPVLPVFLERTAAIQVKSSGPRTESADKVCCVRWGKGQNLPGAF